MKYCNCKACYVAMGEEEEEEEVEEEEKGHPAMDNAVSRRLLQQISRPGRFAQV